MWRSLSCSRFIVLVLQMSREQRASQHGAQPLSWVTARRRARPRARPVVRTPVPAAVPARAISQWPAPSVRGLPGAACVRNPATKRPRHRAVPPEGASATAAGTAGPCDPKALPLAPENRQRRSGRRLVGRPGSVAFGPWPRACVGPYPPPTSPANGVGVRRSRRTWLRGPVRPCRLAAAGDVAGGCAWRADGQQARHCWPPGPGVRSWAFPDQPAVQRLHGAHASLPATDPEPRCHPAKIPAGSPIEPLATNTAGSNEAGRASGPPAPKPPAAAAEPPPQTAAGRTACQEP